MKTPHPRSIAGAVAESVVLGIAVVALAGWLGPKVLPSLFDKRTKQADQSQDASAAVEQAVSKAVEAERAKGAAVAASVQQIGVAAGQLPDSPQKSFIVREGTWMSPLLPPPDLAALLASERRRVALLEGKLELADKLYAQGAKDSAALLARAVKAEAKAEATFASRRAVDTALAESAAYARGKDMVIGLLFAAFALAVCLWLYAKATGLSRVDIARMANRAREGASAMDAIDAVVPDSWHDKIAAQAAKLRAKEAARDAAAQAAARFSSTT
jgi:hypothetical protein